MGMMIVPIFIGRIFKNTITESGNALQEVSAAIQAEYVFVLLGIVSIVVAILLSVSSRRHPELCLMILLSNCPDKNNWSRKEYLQER